MEDILKVVSIAMIGLVGYLILKKWRDDIAILFSLSIVTLFIYDFIISSYIYYHLFNSIL